MLLVAFLYIYLTCVQYIRGEEITIPQTARQSLHGKSTASSTQYTALTLTTLQQASKPSQAASEPQIEK